MNKIIRLFTKLKSMPKRTTAIGIIAAAVIIPSIVMAWEPHVKRTRSLTQHQK